MNILIGFLIAVEIIVSLLLILIVLVQPSKSGGGLGGAAFGGGGMGEQLFGARAGNVLTKATVIFAVIFLVNTLVLALLYSRTSGMDLAPAPQAAVEGLPENLMALPEQPAEPDVVEEPAAEEAAPAPEAALESVESGMDAAEPVPESVEVPEDAQ